MGWVTLSGPVAMDEERFVAAARNSVREKAQQKEMGLLRTRGSAEFGQITSGSVRKAFRWETKKCDLR